MQVVVALYTMGSFRWETLMLSSASFPIYLQALWNAVTRRERQWHVTGRLGGSRSPFNYAFPQVLVFAFLLLTTVVGAWKADLTGSLNIALAWNALNTVVLGIFLTITWREAHEARINRRRARRQARQARRADRRARRGRRRAPAPAAVPTATTHRSPDLVGEPR
jgi:cellulose synthase (UDP-forming)